MPKPKKSTHAQNENSDEEIPTLVPLSDIPKKEKDAYWLELVNDLTMLREVTKPIPFFALLNEFPPAMWEKHLMIYIYRLDPEVRNRGGEKKYIQRVTWAIDEEWVKEKHGGGKYELYLKCGDENLKQLIFSIDGAPKFLPGQTVVGQESPAANPTATAQPGRSDVAEAIRATSEASSASVEIMKTGMASVIEMMADQKVNQPANQLTDLVTVVTALKQLMPAPPAQDPLIAQLVQAAIQNMTNRPPAPEPEAPEPLGKQMETIRALTGADSLPELFRKMNPSRAADDTPAWIPVALNVVSSLLDKLPDILLRNNEAKAMDLQRAMLTQQGRLPATNLQPITIAPPTPRAAPHPIAPATINAPVTQDSIAQAIPAIVNIIASAFDRNFEGAFAAESIDFQFPGILEAVRPLMGNAEKLSQFVAGVPALAERSAALEWPDFQADFLAYINVDDDHQADQSAPPATPDGPKAVAATGAA